MKKFNKFLLAGAASLPLLFSGCAMDDNFTPAPDVNAHSAELKNVILDDQFKDDIKIEFARRWLTESGVTKIAIRGRVRTSTFSEWVFQSYKNITIAYRFAWYDKKGVEVAEDSGNPKWFTVEVRYDEEVGFTSVAPNKECKDFKLFVKLLKQEDSETFKKAQPVIEKKDDPAAISENAGGKKGTVASQIKTAPTAVTPLAKPKTSEEAEADAAAVRQATPAPKTAPVKPSVKK